MRKIPRGYTKEQLYILYIEENLTREKIAEMFNVTVNVIEKDVSKYGFKKTREQKIASNGSKKEIDKNELYQYYIIENHTTEETAEHFKVHERTIRRRLSSFGICKDISLQKQAAQRVQKEKYGALFTQSEYYRNNVVEKMKMNMEATCYSKYGVRSVFMQKDFPFKRKCSYTYDGVVFDSSWELALWIYAKDHDEEIQRLPFRIEYFYEGKKHYYNPDFLYKGEIVEIKGDHLIDENGELSSVYSDRSKKGLKAKMECIKEHGVRLYTRKEITPILKYIDIKYGKNYLKLFKNERK